MTYSASKRKRRRARRRFDAAVRAGDPRQTPPLDIRVGLQALAIAVTLLTILLGFGPRRYADYFLVAVNAGAIVVLVYGPLYGHARRHGREWAVLTLQAIALLGPFFVAAAFAPATVGMLAGCTALLAAVGAGLELLRRKAAITEM